MQASIWQALEELSWQNQLCFGFTLLVAFGFEFINGFHDTANAVATVIYTKTLPPGSAVILSGFCNFLGVIVGTTAVAFVIVNLLPVDLLIESSSVRGVVMVLSLLLAGVIWNLGTWWMGLPVSSSHTLIGSIVGVGMANSLLTKGSLIAGVNWTQVENVALALLISPVIGFVGSAALMWIMRGILRDKRLYEPPGATDQPPRWIRAVLLATCSAVSFAHGSNDGQKGMGLVLLILIGFLPTYYALDLHQAGQLQKTRDAAIRIGKVVSREDRLHSSDLDTDLDQIVNLLEDKREFSDVPAADRWKVRRAIYECRKRLGSINLSPHALESIRQDRRQLEHAIEFVPLWVKIGVAVVLGLGTMIGYQRIVVTVAEKIGKTHLTYAQGGAAEVVAATTILLADVCHLPVSTTHVLSSGVAGTMYANRSGLQWATLTKIAAAWVLTLPASTILAGTLFGLGVAMVE